VPLYRYEALDQAGNTVVGAMQVADERALTARLHSMGYQPTTVQVAQRSLREAQQQVGTSARTLAFSAPPAAARTSNISAGERAIARMFHQLHLAFRAGMPAFQALTTVQAQVYEPSLRAALGEIALGVRDGSPLSGVMEQYPRLFSRGDVGMIRAAESAGFLPEAMESLAVQHEQDDNTRRRLRIWVWFFHSNVAVFFLLIALSFFFRPAVEAGFKAEAGFRAVGWALVTITLPLTALYFGAVAYLGQVRHIPRLAFAWHRFLLRVPVVGKINILRANAVFTRTLEQVYRAGIRAETAWETAAAAVPNLCLGARFAAGKSTLEETQKFSAALQQVGLLDISDVGMIATGESSGEVDQALAYLANRYEEDTRVALGASVMRGAVSFMTWAFILGGIAFALLVYSVYGHIFEAVSKGMGE
jgi:type II secretory pathway component PulF